tara:strand:- start:146 stop:556 length:411 start_codon:yes stop_codon:yes gene_type:complete
MGIIVGTTQHLNTTGQLQNISSLDSTTATTISDSVTASGGGGDSLYAMGYAQGGASSTSTLYRFSTAISLPAGHTVTGWSSDGTNMAVSWRDNYQGSTTILGTGSYTNSGGSAINVYAWCNTSGSSARSVTYMIFG